MAWLVPTASVGLGPADRLFVEAAGSPPQPFQTKPAF
jgi:hypothetical protein